jgi:hypothetical protein
VLAVGGAVTTGGDAVPDGDLLRADEDVLDEEPQDPMAFFERGGGGVAAQLGEEAFEVISGPEAGVAVSCLGVQGTDLGAQSGLPCVQVRHPGTQLVDGQQLLGERLDHRGDRSAGLRQLEFEAVPLPGDRVGGPGLFEPLTGLGADQDRVGEQVRDVVPDDGVEVVGADWLWSCRTPPCLRRRGCAAWPRPRCGPTGTCRSGSVRPGWSASGQAGDRGAVGGVAAEHLRDQDCLVLDEWTRRGRSSGR